MSTTEKEKLKEVERALRLLWQRGYDTAKIAELLSMNENVVYNYMLKFNILKSDTRDLSVDPTPTKH